MSLVRSTRLLAQNGRSFARAASITQLQQRSCAMAFTFASPGNAFYEGAEIKQVDVPGFDSARGILPQHVPLLAVMQPGQVIVTESDDTKKSFFVSSGTITVNDDSSVQILAEEAVPIEQLDKQAITEGLSVATKELDAAKTEAEKAEAQIMIDTYNAMLSATGVN